MSSTCVISIDLQYGFFDSRLAEVGRLEKALCLPGARRLIRHARSQGWPVIHALTQHSGLETLPFHLFKLGVAPYCLEGTEGAEIIDALAAEGDVLVRKRLFSAFSGTELSEVLAGYDSIVLCGVAMDCCVLQTAMDAANRRKHVYVPYQAVSASSLEAYVGGLAATAKSAGAVVNLDALEGISSSAHLWDARIAAEDLRESAGQWFSSATLRLREFRSQRADLFEATVTPREALASLEAFLAGLVGT